MAQAPSPTAATGPGMAGVVERNIRALLERRLREEDRRPLQARLADAVTQFTGSMTFVYVHLAVYGLWVAANLPGVSPVPPFDPTFVILAMTASVESIFLSTFILISQNRMAALADRRADLDLQISLLAEHEVTRLITLVAAIARRVGIEEANDPELAELARDVAPERVLDAIEQHEQQSEGGNP